MYKNVVYDALKIFLWKREGLQKKRTLCSLLTMLTITYSGILESLNSQHAVKQLQENKFLHSTSAIIVLKYAAKMQIKKKLKTKSK